jgi:hypothetical protein
MSTKNSESESLIASAIAVAASDSRYKLIQMLRRQNGNGVASHGVESKVPQNDVFDWCQQFNYLAEKCTTSPEEVFKE